ncbi:MAG: ribonuclease PH [Gammaproteobacteria bacterium]
MKPEDQNQIRPVSIERGFSPHAEGSALIQIGLTQILCTATVDDTQPRWLKGTPSGWVTAEYAMLPRATHSRVQRHKAQNSGRSHEIQRLISRSLRQAVDLEDLRGYTITVDCDVLVADGGTRTGAITGGCVALFEAISKISDLSTKPARSLVSAISVGYSKGRILLDMDYKQDSTADVDLNLVINESGEIIEVQATGERKAFSREQLDSMLNVGQEGCRQLFIEQRKALAGVI